MFALADEVAAHPDGLRAVEPLLRLLERNPRLDWGAPGPVVHAAESFSRRGYEALLLESLRRTPTGHTLWMANRLMNGMPLKEREPFLAVVGQAGARADITDEARRSAQRFVELQQSRE